MADDHQIFNPHIALKRVTVCLAVLWLLVCLCCNRVAGQAEVSGWGNLRGIRVGGQLVAFTTAVGVYNPDFSQLTLSQREGPIRTSQYVRNENTVTVGERLQYGAGGGRGEAGQRGATNAAAATNSSGTTNLGGGFGRRGAGGDGFNYTMTYTDSAPGACDVSLRLTSTTNQTIGGIYYFLILPAGDFADGTAQLIGGSDAASAALRTLNNQGRYLSGSGTGIRLSGKKHEQVEVSFGQESEVVVQPARTGNYTDRGARNIQVYFPIAIGNTTAGQIMESHFTLKASGDVEAGPVMITIDPSKTGRIFVGMGGNYRIQSPRDRQVIQYIMDNMRVAYGRVAMPWNVWQPEENSPPPLLAAEGVSQAAPGGSSAPPAAGGRGGGMNSIASSMEIAQKLARQDIPMMISCWFPPSWAVLNNGARGGRGGGGGGGQRLDPAKWDAICKSIGSYLVFLRSHFGAEPQYFSFNESNIGIVVWQSPEEHDEAIKKLGAYFKSIGLKTRMLLGDTGDAPPVSFIQAALNDPEAAPYIGAVSFHSWRGATDEQYQKWADAASKLGVPLFDAEGGNDAQASTYPNVLREAWYALDEAAEYVRIMRVCQPESILEWQLTQDYSVLKSDASGALQPTQRFHNLKQFNLTPAGSSWIPAQSSSGLVLPAACVDPSRSVCTVHLVNNGASRPVTLAGLPAAVTQMSIYVTDEKRGMEKLEPVRVKNGSAQFTLQGQTLTTLINATKG
jgi:O-glycosyl hydrolase